MVEEELEAAEGCLRASSREGHEVRGPEKPVAVDGPENVEVARRERHVAHGGALEAGPTGLDLRHKVKIPGSRNSGKAAGSAAEPALNLRLHLLPWPSVPLP